MRELDLYKLEKDIYIIEGTPFLYIRSHSALVLGDLHLGQEEGIFNHPKNTVSFMSTSSKLIIDLLYSLVSELKVSKIIINGDIKHSSKNLLKQEMTELRYLFSNSISKKIDIQLIRGNHDEYLDQALTRINPPNVKISDFVRLENNDRSIYIFHGHKDMSIDTDIVVLSHEHPAYTLRSVNGTKAKLQAFVQIFTDVQGIIILPSANHISSGVPIKSNHRFNSPYLLNKQRKFKTMHLYPFDPITGVLPLPPILFE
jgi:hypothetical protein